MLYATSILTICLSVFIWCVSSTIDVSNQYLVRLHVDSTVHKGTLEAHLLAMKLQLGDDKFRVLHVYNELLEASYLVATNGGRFDYLPHYSAYISTDSVRFVENHSSVDRLEDNTVYSIDDCVEQSKPDWGLSRVNQRGVFHYDSYFYESTNWGQDVNTYILDTGIYCENNDFVNKLHGTCTYGIDVIDGSNVDSNGHGTHCAGTVGGRNFGVAKGVNLIAVRVLNEEGSGTTSGIVAGINWMIGHSKNSSESSVANLSLGGSFSQTLNDAVAAAFAANITMVVAAGNDNDNACQYSPASESSALTIAASDTTDARASYSNYGVCVDLFAPGSSITSAWIGFPSAQMVLSGTSMAAPHVTGVAALILSTAVASSNNTYSLNSLQVSALVVSTATENVLTNTNGTRFVIDTLPADVSPNLLAYTPACGNSTTNGDGGNVSLFSNTKSAFRFFVLVFLGVYSLEMGMMVKFEALKVHVGGVLPALLNQALIVPVLSCVMLGALSKQMHAGYDIGLLMIAISPCGVLSNSIVQISRLSVPLSVSLTYFANLLGSLAIPLLLVLYLRTIYPMQHHDTTCSLNRLCLLVTLMMGGSLLGTLLTRVSDRVVVKYVSWLVSAASAALFSISLGLVVIAYGSDIQKTPFAVWVVCLILQLLATVLGYIIAKCVTQTSPLDRLSIAVESSFKNFMIPLAVIMFAFHSTDKDKIISVPLVYAISTLLNMLWLVPALWVYGRALKQFSANRDDISSPNSNRDDNSESVSVDGVSVSVLGPLAPRTALDDSSRTLTNPNYPQRDTTPPTNESDLAAAITASENEGGGRTGHNDRSDTLKSALLEEAYPII